MFRFAQGPLPPDQITQLISTIERLHKPTLRALFEYLRGDRYCLWELLDVPVRFTDLHDEYVPCPTVLFDADAMQTTV